MFWRFLVPYLDIAADTIPSRIIQATKVFLPMLSWSETIMRTANRCLLRWQNNWRISQEPAATAFESVRQTWHLKSTWAYLSRSILRHRI